MRRRHSGHHDGFGVASQAVLQQPGQHRIPVWDVRLPPRSPPCTGPPAAGYTADALAAAQSLGVLGLKSLKEK